jgi:hypothetical protein
VRQWLEEKRSRGVRSVGVKAVLDQIAAENGAAADPLAGMTKRQKMALLKRLLYEVKPEFVGTKEASELLGVERPRIGRYLRKGIMPEPIGVVSKGIPFWLKADVEPLRKFVEGRRRDDREASNTAG